MTTETSTPSRQRDSWNTAVVQKKTGHAIRIEIASQNRSAIASGRLPSELEVYRGLRMTGSCDECEGLLRSVIP